MMLVTIINMVVDYYERVGSVSKNTKKNIGSLLFPLPSFLEGMGSSIDLSGNNYKRYNKGKFNRKNDWDALKADYNVLGNDFRNAILEKK